MANKNGDYSTKSAWRGGRLPRAEVDRRVDALLLIAAEEFAANGFARTNVDRLVERSGVSKTTIFRRFGNKEGLFRALIDGAVQTIHSGLRAVPLDRTQPLQTLTNLVTAYVETAVAPHLNHVLFAVGILERTSVPALSEMLLTQSEEGLGPIRGYISDLMSDGVLASGSQREATFELQAMITHGFRVMIDDPVFLQAEDRAAHLAARFLKAWAP